MHAQKPWLLPAVYILSGALIALILFQISQPPHGQAIVLTPAATLALRVQVDGQVVHPGIYTLAPGSRVEDAILASGGTLSEADTTRINLARPVRDGEKIVIPAEGAVASTDEPLLDLNQATLKQLDALPGIGEVKANAILAYRSENGPFVSVEELLKVPGISADVYEQIKDLVAVY